MIFLIHTQKILRITENTKSNRRYDLGIFRSKRRTPAELAPIFFSGGGDNIIAQGDNPGNYLGKNQFGVIFF